MKKQIITKILYSYSVLALIISCVIIHSNIVTYYKFTHGVSYHSGIFFAFFMLITSELAAFIAFLYKREEKKVSDYIVVIVVCSITNILIFSWIILMLIKTVI